MAQYGEVIAGNYNPEREGIYVAFTEYFENPSMTKIKDIDAYSMYVAKIHCMLSNVNRYVIVFVERDNYPLDTTLLLKDMNWISLQTRSLTDVHNLPPQTYRPRRLKSLMKEIKLQGRDEEKNYVYACQEYPVRITLLARKPKEELEYPILGKIVTALEEYNTIVTFA